MAAAEKTTVTVYYLSLDGAYLVPLSLDIPATDLVARVALEQLLASPPTDLLQDSVPGDAKLIDLYTIYNTVYVDLTREFLDIPADQMQTAIDAICVTVLPLADGYKLQLLVEGAGYPELGPVATDEPLTMPLVNPDTRLLDEGSDLADLPWVRWYQAQEGSPLLIPRSLYYPQDTDPLTALAQAGLPPGLTLNSISLSDGVQAAEGLLTLDLSFDPNVAYRCGQAYEQSWLQALARSLCRTTGALSMAVTIDGQAATALPKGADITRPLAIDTPINYQALL